MAIIRLRQPAYPGRSDQFNIFQNEMNRLFERFFGGETTSSAGGVFPPVNIYEDNDNFYLTAELPGMESSDVKLDVDEDGILIQGERKIEAEGESVCYHRREREGGSFSRKINFNNKIDTEKIVANLQNGILKITLPRAHESMPKKIAVKTG